MNRTKPTQSVMEAMSLMNDIGVHSIVVGLRSMICDVSLGLTELNQLNRVELCLR